MLTFHLITIFPEIFDSYLNESILKRAQQEKKIRIKVYNLRDFTDDKHKTVDDTPYGGGPGMVLKIEPIYKCVEKIKSDIQKRGESKGEFTISPPSLKLRRAGNSPNSPKKTPKTKNQNSNSLVILTSAKGEEYTQKKAEKLKNLKDIIIICGRYEGVDERVANYIADEEISIGKYVLTGGELPAMVIVDSVTRLLEGVLGNKDSLMSESYGRQQTTDNRQQDVNSNQKDYPVYTKPDEFQGWKVPEVLLSGNHEEIGKWRRSKK